MLNFKLLVEDKHKHKHITEMTGLLTVFRNKLPLCVRDIKLKDYGLFSASKGRHNRHRLFRIFICERSWKL